MLYRLVSLTDLIRTGSVRQRQAALAEVRATVGGLRAADTPRSEDPSAAPQVTPAAREAISAIALCVQPLLGRVVFAGRAAAELLASEPVFRARFPEDASVTLLTSFALERMAGEMQTLGAERVRRDGHTDVWRLPGGATADLTHVETGADTGSPWHEYALLLTRDVEVAPSCSVRVSGGPATAALLFDRHEGERLGTMSDSLALEDLILLVAGRPELAAEVRAAPAELRAYVAARSTALVRSGSAQGLVEHAAPDAAASPAMVDDIVQRLRRLSELA